ncbi:MAG: hypothetical protein V1808_04060 [Candidatus Daviesbacteria bacterium]
MASQEKIRDAFPRGLLEDHVQKESGILKTATSTKKNTHPSIIKWCSSAESTAIALIIYPSYLTASAVIRFFVERSKIKKDLFGDSSQLPDKMPSPSEK